MGQPVGIKSEYTNTELKQLSNLIASDEWAIFDRVIQKRRARMLEELTKVDPDKLLFLQGQIKALDQVCNLAKTTLKTHTFFKEVKNA